MSDSVVKQITDKLYADHGTPVRENPYRVWHIPQIPGKPFRVEVPDVKTAALVEGLLAAYDEFQFENNIKPDYANMGGIEVWDETEGEWIAYEEDE